MRQSLQRRLFLTAVPLMFASTSQAGPKDLKIFKALSRAGVHSMHRVAHQMRVNDIQCTSSMMTQKAHCTMKDVSHGEAAHASVLTVSGKAAKSIFKILVTSGAHGDSGAGRAMIAAKSIHCTQEAPKVEDDSAADRTSCLVEVGNP